MKFSFDTKKTVEYFDIKLLPSSGEMNLDERVVLCTKVNNLLFHFVFHFPRKGIEDTLACWFHNMISSYYICQYLRNIDKTHIIHLSRNHT